MKRLKILAATSLLLLNSCIVIIRPRAHACLPINSQGNANISITTSKKTKVDRGQLIQTNHNGPYRYYNETFGQTLYIYEGDQLKARVVNPASVEIN